MKPSDVDVLPAGRELDALVAEKVMGWISCSATASFDYPVSGVGFGLGTPPEGWVGRHTTFSRKGVIPDYSIDISAAWEVLEKMRTYRQEPAMFATPTPIFTLFMVEIDQMARRCDVRGATIYDVLAKLDPAMICRAALKAVLWAEQEAKVKA